MTWRNGRLYGGIGKRVFADLLTVDPEAGTITRGKGWRRETHDVTGVQISLDHGRITTHRGMFGRPVQRMTHPVLSVVGEGWSWYIRVHIPDRTHRFLGEWHAWRQSGVSPARQG